MKLKKDVVYSSINNILNNWGHGEPNLKYEYKNEHASEVKTYKLSKKQLEEYLKKYKK